MFPFLSQVQVFSYETLFVCRLKCSCSCFPSHFFCLLMFVLSALFPTSVIIFFFMLYSNRFIDASSLSSMLANLLSFFDTYNLSLSSLCYKALYVIMSFLVLCSICCSSSIVHFKNGPEYLTRGTAQVVIPLLCSLVLSSFLVLLGYLLNFFFPLLMFNGVRF